MVFSELDKHLREFFKNPASAVSPKNFRALRCLRLSFIALFFVGALDTLAASSRGWVSLFNGKDWTGIERYLAPVEGTKTPLGLDNDPKAVFTIRRVDGRPAIHVTGEVYGALTSMASFTNVHVRVQYKWGELKWPPRNGPRHYRDAGLLYWCVGEHGAGSGAWMRSVEHNIMEKGVGQWWSVAGVYCDVEGRSVVLDQEPSVPYRGEGDGEKCVLWVPGGPKYTVKSWEGITSPYDYEKPHGQWNVAEAIAWGPICIHLLNGKVVLVITNPRVNEGGKEKRMTHGRIQLQSEAAELFYRGFEAREINEIPKELLSFIPVEPADDSGFIPLIQNSSTDGWKQCGPGGFNVENGIATGISGMGLWWYAQRPFTNFVMRGEWRQVGKKSNSGIFFRFPNPGSDPWIAVRQGHEFEIGDAGASRPREGTGSFYPFKGPVPLPLRKIGEWNNYELTCVGPNYSLRINGKVVNTWTDDQGRPLSGYIGIQNYDYPDAVEHRNVRIKDIL